MSLSPLWERGDERVCLVDQLEVRVAPVVRVPGAVVGERARLVRGFDTAPDFRAGRRLGVVVSVLVDVVPDVEDEIKVIPLGDSRVDVEVAGRVLGSGDERAAQALAASDGRCPRPPDR